MNPNNTLRMRLEGFTDGVVAIAITLLALELPKPHIVSSDLSAGVMELVQHLPGFAAFLLSFITIAIFWVNHHQLTQHISISDGVGRRIIWGNTVFLMFVTLIPFAATAVTENSFHVVSVLMYASILFGASASFAIMRSWIHHTSMKESSAWRSLVGPILYALAILVLPLVPVLAYILLVVPPLYYFLPRSKW